MSRTVALLTLTTLSSCATIFTGTRQSVGIDSNPPGATIVAMGGSFAQLVARAKNIEGIKETVVSLMRPWLSPQVLAVLDVMTLDELLTQLVLFLKPIEGPPAVVLKEAAALFAALPGGVRDEISNRLGFEGLGFTPTQVELKKGAPHLLISFQAGRAARLFVIGTKFNFVVLFDIFTLGIGLIVDVATGAWLNLTPTTIDCELPPRAN